MITTKPLTKEELAKLSIDKKAEELIKEASSLFMNGFNRTILSKEDNDKFSSLICRLNERKDVENNVNKLITLLRKYPQIEDYQILIPILDCAKDIGMSKENFVKKFILEIPNQKPKDNNPKTETLNNSTPKNDNSKIETTKKDDSKVNVSMTRETGAAKDMSKTMTASDIVANCNAHANQTQQELNQQPPVQQPLVNNQQIIAEKVAEIKKHINFVQKGIELKEHEINALYDLVKGSMLKSKLKELNSTCNPEYPILTQTTKYNFDASFNYAFYAESNNPGKAIVVLFNTHPKQYANGYVGNESGYGLVNIEEVK